MGWGQLPPEKDMWPSVCKSCLLLESRVRELEAERDRLKGIISKIADGLNTPWPFPDKESEHDEILIDSAVDAGKSLQTIGNEILKSDWSLWIDIPPLVKELRARHAALVKSVNKIFNCYTPGFISPELLEELKAALAEVK